MNRIMFDFVLIFISLISFSLCLAETPTAPKDAETPSISSRTVPIPMRDRWFYASFGLRSDEDAAELTALVTRAGSEGLNGMLWACGMETCGHWSPEALQRFAKIKAAADAAGVEIIPIIWSVGYGTMIPYNNNLVEGGLVSDLPCVVRDGKLQYDETLESIAFVNGGFESYDPNKKRFDGFSWFDKPETISFCDTNVKHSGNASLRLENFKADTYGHGRSLQKIRVLPHRNYRIHVWYKTEKTDADGQLRLQIYTKNGSLATCVPPIPEDGTIDWTEHTLDFNSGEYDEILFYAGIWDGTKGKIWFDDFSIEPRDMTAPLQRPGTPVTVKNAENGKIYELGKDFTLPPFSMNAFRKGTPTAPILISEQSSISEGTRLLVSYYVPILTLHGQTSTCMSEPELYERFEDSANQMMKLLAPKKWFLSMDEIRAANTCKACENRKMTLAQILGDCITRQYEIIQKVQPGAEVYIWSDMLDPKHNCHKDYMACRGDFTGVWDLIPKEIIISCWYHKIREESFAFFSEHGFRTQAAAYYDVDSLDTSREWLELCRRTPKCTGIMYTTWRHKYELLDDFARMLKENE